MAVKPEGAVLYETFNASIEQNCVPIGCPGIRVGFDCFVKLVVQVGKLAFSAVHDVVVN